MDYVQIPAASFYFVFGIVVGIISTIIILVIIANRQEKKNKEKARDLFNTLSQLGNEQIEEKSVKKRKVDK